MTEVRGRKTGFLSSELGMRKSEKGLRTDLRIQMSEDRISFRCQGKDDRRQKSEDRFLEFGMRKKGRSQRLFHLDFKMWIAEVKSRINPHYKWRTNQLNKPNKHNEPNKLHKLTPRERSHADTCLTDGPGRLQRSYNSQMD